MRQAVLVPRIPRLVLPGVSLHIVQRGNNRQVVFFDAADYRLYLDTLFEPAQRYDVSLTISFDRMSNGWHWAAMPVSAAQSSATWWKWESTRIT